LPNETTVFNQVTPDPVTPVVVPSTPVLPQDVSEFVGVGKKYASVDDALKSVPHAQKHINTLEEELALVKAELVKRRTTEELLTELKSTSNSNDGTPPQNNFTSEDLQKIVKQTIEQNEQQVVSKNNINLVTSAFTEKFGDKAEAMFISIAQESGISISNLNRLAASSPAVVMKLAGLVSKKVDSIVTKPSGTINTQTLNDNGNQTSLTARVKQGASTKDLVSAWKIAGQKVGKTT
jgi:hypothetical protein